MGKRARERRRQERQSKPLPPDRDTPRLLLSSYLGTEFANDEPALTFDQRISRCYELATYAVIFGEAGADSLLVHGSWHGPEAERRIPHAWVELYLPSWGKVVWEPIRASVYDRDEFYHWTDAREERSYSLKAARTLTQANGHYGPWHRSPAYPDDAPDMAVVSEEKS